MHLECFATHRIDIGSWEPVTPLTQRRNEQFGTWLARMDSRLKELKSKTRERMLRGNKKPGNWRQLQKTERIFWSP